MDKKVNDVDPNTHIRTDVSLARNKSGTGGGWDFSQGQFQETVVENTGSVCSLGSGENFLADIHVTGTNSCNVSSSVDVRLNLLGCMGCSFYEVILRCGIVSCRHSTHLAQGQWW